MSLPRRLSRLPVRMIGDFGLFSARTPWSRLLGLAGLRRIPSGAVLELEGTRSVHTCWMRFPIDLVWLDADGAVLHVDVEVPPWRVRSLRTARTVLECPAWEGVALASTLYGACRP